METRQSMRKEIEASKLKLLDDFEKNKSKKSKMEVSTMSGDNLNDYGHNPNLNSSKSAQKHHHHQSNNSPNSMPDIHYSKNRFEKQSTIFNSSIKDSKIIIANRTKHSRSSLSPKQQKLQL